MNSIKPQDPEAFPLPSQHWQGLTVGVCAVLWQHHKQGVFSDPNIRMKRHMQTSSFLLYVKSNKKKKHQRASNHIRKVRLDEAMLKIENLRPGSSNTVNADTSPCISISKGSFMSPVIVWQDFCTINIKLLRTWLISLEVMGNTCKRWKHPRIQDLVTALPCNIPSHTW